MLYTIENETLFWIANAIRNKRDITTPIKPEDMAMQISLIKSGGGNFASGDYEVTEAFSTTPITINHGLGQAPDFVMFFSDGDKAQTYSMLFAVRSSLMAYQSANHTALYGYHGNSTSTVSTATSNNASYGVGSINATSFSVRSHSSSYSWRAGAYKWIAIKFY